MSHHPVSNLWNSEKTFWPHSTNTTWKTVTKHLKSFHVFLSGFVSEVHSYGTLTGTDYTRLLINDRVLDGRHGESKPNLLNSRNTPSRIWPPDKTQLHRWLSICTSSSSPIQQQGSFSDQFTPAFEVRLRYRSGDEEEKLQPAFLRSLARHRPCIPS